MWRVTISDF